MYSPAGSVAAMWEVQVTRGELVESRHTLWAVMTDREGATISETLPGDGERVIFLRSAAKPFQAAGAVDAGVLEAFGLDDRHLAIGCSSHGGDESSVATVKEILDSAGVDRSMLTPGNDGQGGPLHHQCSGNHALALAWCVARGWDPATYLDPDHPVQHAMAESVGVAAGARPVLAPDNCGMTAHGLPMATIGRMFVALAGGHSEVSGLDRVADAMRAHPAIVGSYAGIDGEMMIHNPALVAKYGAEGLTVAATPDAALVVRVADGARRAMTPAVRTLATAWTGWSVGRAEGRSPGSVVNRDASGKPVGELRAVRVDPEE